MNYTKGPWKGTNNNEFIGSSQERELFQPKQATVADIRLVKEENFRC